ncbi:MAG: hypothetical protein ACQEP1_03795 [Nanobdellota archaeon]
MKDEELKIIELFKERQREEISTYEIAESIYPDKFSELKKADEFYDNQKKSEVKKEKARLHRKTLYYINKLVEKGILKLGSKGGKGRKSFIMTEDNPFTQSTARSHMPAMPIEGYENKGIIKKGDKSNLINRINSIILQSKMFRNLDELEETIKEMFSYVNDAIGINDFETLIEENTGGFLERLDKESINYGKEISLIIDFSNIRNTEKTIKMLDSFTELDIENINIIFDISPEELKEHEEIMKHAVKRFSERKRQLYIKNQKSHDAPFILGSDGPYTFRPYDWNNFRLEMQGRMKSIICSQSTIKIDLPAFFRESKSYKLKELILNISKSLLYSNSEQASRSNDQFRKIINMNDSRRLFSFSRDYIRFLDYEPVMSELDHETMLSIMKTCKKIAEDFGTTEESIYKSCGMPRRFRIAFGSTHNITKIRVNSINDLSSQENKEIIYRQEELNPVFDGGETFSILRRNEFTIKDIIHEIDMILSTYNIPFFCYDFGQRKDTDMTLTNFLK